jgi:hypothetical protein
MVRGRPRVLSDEERKANKKAIANRPENKEKARLHSQKDEVKEMKRVRAKLPENRKKKKAWEQSLGGRATRKANRDLPKNKANAKLRRAKPENIAKEKSRVSTPEYKNRTKTIRDKKRINICQIYSKRLSNSNIPCCRCCGLNSDMDFLALDHIAGKRQMDSEPELVKLGYSSKKKSETLHNWIIKNNYPDGFQVLCQSCNFAKGMKKNNNKCPMENKPHF